MPIKSNRGPLGGRAVMAQALSTRILRTVAESSPTGGGTQTGSPLPVYQISVDHLYEADPLARARVRGWRYPVIDGNRPALADVNANSDTGVVTFVGLARGSLATRLMEAAMLAENVLGATTEVFEPRLLDVPALQFSALWLHGANREYFISLMDGLPAGAAALKIVDDVTPLLQMRAQAIPTTDSGPQGLRDTRVTRTTPTN